MIEICDYRDSWRSEFELLRSQLDRVLEGLALRVDHIGSTSVPGLGAKDIIDIQVTVRDLSPPVIDRMVAAGFRLSDFRQDHVPEGEDQDPRLWEKRLFGEKPGQRRANIHVRVLGKPNQTYPLLFRDYLREHHQAAAILDRIKRQLARYHADDVEAYYDIKDPVYDLIWTQARDWAARTGWPPA